MNKIAKFEKVSYEQFEKDYKTTINEYENIEKIQEMYDKIEIPTRATKMSAGYDFKIPFSIYLHKNESIVIPTGIRCKMEDGWVLKLYPRSGLGFKYGMQLINTVGIIDGDYYNSDNEGHIMVKVYHKFDDYTIKLKQRQGFIQGLFVPFGITEDDNVEQERNGGFGSTDK